MLSTDSRNHGDTIAAEAVNGLTVYLHRTGATTYRVRALVSGCMVSLGRSLRTERAGRRAFDAAVANFRTAGRILPAYPVPCALCGEDIGPRDDIATGQASGPRGVILRDDEVSHRACLDARRGGAS